MYELCTYGVGAPLISGAQRRGDVRENVVQRNRLMGLVMAVLTAGALVTTTGAAASAAQGAPTLNWATGSVTTIGHLPAGIVAGTYSNGVNYVATQTAIYSMSSLGVIQLLAGNPDTSAAGSCGDSQTGSGVRFRNVRALAIQGTHLFAADGCQGLRETDIITGATVTDLELSGLTQDVVAGADGQLYVTYEQQGRLTSYDPNSSATHEWLVDSDFNNQSSGQYVLRLRVIGDAIYADFGYSGSYGFAFSLDTATVTKRTRYGPDGLWCNLSSEQVSTGKVSYLVMGTEIVKQLSGYTFPIVAGSTTPGNQDGIGEAARFTGLKAVWTDGSLLYTGDDSGRITMISPVTVSLPVSLGASADGVQLYPPTGISVQNVANSGTKLLDFLLDGVSHPLAADGSLPPLPDGEHVLTIRVTNPDGSISIARTLQVVIDATAPLVSLALGLTVKVKGILALLGTGCVNISALDPLGALHLASGLASLRIGVDLPVDVRPTSLLTAVCALSPGLHTLSWEAEDNAGNATAGLMTLRWLPPLALTLTSPAANTITAGSQVLSYGQTVTVLGAATPQAINGARIVAGTVSVNGAIQNLVDGLDYTVQVLVDGRPVGSATVNGGAWSFALPTGGLTAGAHTLTASITDGVSDTAQTTPVTLTVVALPGTAATPAKVAPLAKTTLPVRTAGQRKAALR